MNPLSSVFANLYLGCGLIAAVAVVMRVTERVSSGQRLLSTALVVPFVIVYLVGMHRIAGTDYENYLAAYTDQGQPIPDLGYTALTGLMREVGVDFSTFLLLQGIFTLAALWVVSKAKGADPVVVLVVYLLHLAIVRDLSQSRIGLAVAIYLLGQTRQRVEPKILLYLFALSIHITVVVLMFIWAYATLTSRLKLSRQVFLLYLPLLVFAVYGGALLDVASAFEPRVAIYLAWDDDAYGAPLASFGALFRTIPIVGVFCLAAIRFKEIRLREYIVLELAGAAILFGFAEFSIFSARLSNVAISMYPIGLGIIAQAYRSCRPNRRWRPYSMGIKVTVGATLAVLVVRPGSFDALLQVMPSAFEWLSS